MSPVPSLAPFRPFNRSTSLAWDEGQTGPPVELGKAQFKELRALGHKVERFLAACSHWWRQSAKAGHPILPEWMLSLTASPPVELAGEGFFACALTHDQAGFRLQSPILPRDEAQRCAELWQRIDPEAGKPLPPALDVPDGVNAPIWFALLRLRPLRDFWERELRRSTFGELLQLMPDAWLLDPTPLPHGAVIPRLELPSWDELAKCRDQGRSFAITSAHSVEDALELEAASTDPELLTATQKVLEDFPNNPRVLLDVSSGSEPTQKLLVAIYEKKAGRVEALGILAFVADGKGVLLPARVLPK